MTIYLLILFGLYFVSLCILRIGWSKAGAKMKTDRLNTCRFITVVIPIRNEERSLGPLLRSLANQNYLKKNFEVIIVDDHSTDGSIEICNGSLQNLTVHPLGQLEKGKKAALAHGIYFAKGEIIATTDADCVLPPDWLMNVNAAFQNERITMAAGMVVIEDTNTFFSCWQAMEFASVMGTGVAAFGLNRPLMCNGANLSYRKKVFDEVKGYEGNNTMASGDDEFLMRKILKRFPNSIQLINSVVVTQPQASIRNFLQQRIRWASKWKGNPSLGAKMVAVFIFFMQVSWILFFSTFYRFNPKIVFTLLMLKIMADLLFLWPVFRFLDVRFKLMPFLGLQLFYPFYVILVGLLAPWTSYHWKGRKILH